jgi:hypothetical protein
MARAILGVQAAIEVPFSVGVTNETIFDFADK